MKVQAVKDYVLEATPKRDNLNRWKRQNNVELRDSMQPYIFNLKDQ